MRLAHEQGLLTQRSLNHFQKWALLYWVWMEQRNRGEEMRAQLEHQTFNLNPERWALLYRDQMLGEMGIADENGELQLGADDLDDLDRYMDEQEARFQKVLNGKHTMSANQVEPLSWGPWS